MKPFALELFIIHEFGWDHLRREVVVQFDLGDSMLELWRDAHRVVRDWK